MYTRKERNLTAIAKKYCALVRMVKSTGGAAPNLLYKKNPAVAEIVNSF